MNELVLTREQVRRVDQIAIEEYGIPGIVLMENAGRNTAEVLRQRSPVGQVTILCGKGNNGGDGFVIARHLNNSGHDVSVVLFADPDELKGDAATNFAVLQKMDVPIVILTLPDDQDQFAEQLNQSAWLVDALLGTGTKGEAREPFLSVIRAVNQSGKPILAVDVPSGLDCNEGPVDGATIKAQITATFVALKPGLIEEHTADFVGQIQVIDIGAPTTILTQVLET